MTWSGEVIGHRGAAGLAPENTVESFEAAVAAGADRVEFDVRRTRDGHAVVFHDLNLDRFSPEARGRSVSVHTLAQMQALDVGASLGRPGCFVPSLDDVLARLAGRILFNVEIKGSGADGLSALALASAAIQRAGVAASTILSSFHEPVMRRMRDEADDIARAFIVDERTDGDVVARATAMRCEAIHPRSSLVDEPLVERCRAVGLRIRAWTVNDEAEMRRLMALGIDGIVTDFPNRLRALL
jgi:glycerophosphoryl diester phosphodiesterase